jgi:transcriptional regulator with GAF, ATPase, and Fis domain
MKRDGRFREDFYYRLKVFEIHLPPLREKKGDIVLLAKYFLYQLRRKGRTSAATFTDDAIELMLSCSWPGNVRELKSAVESAALRCKLESSNRITRKHLAPLLMADSLSYSDETKKGIFKSLAETELKLIEKALVQSGGKKTEAWKLLDYPSRFTMLRRVKRILSEHPDIVDKFPEVKKSYGVT